MRIISTVPSITELLYDLDLEDEVVGITKFCIHPNQWFRSKERIGGTKTLDLAKIKVLAPTLVICNKEENVKDQIDQLSTFTQVHITDIKSPADNLELITTLGELTDRRMTAIRIKAELESALESLNPSKQLSAVYLIWQDPYMTVGHDTYIHAVMKKCGFKNLFLDKKRYPVTTLEEIAELNPDIILLSSEPFPFKEKHLDQFSSTLPHSKVVLVDGEFFSWYGSRIIKKSGYLAELISTLS